MKNYKIYNKKALFWGYLQTAERVGRSWSGHYF